jgi:hypothetical protein
MRFPALLTTALAALLLLSSCAPSSNRDGHQSSSPSPTASMPAFLAGDQLAADSLPAGVADTVGVGQDSTRYQGEWDGREIFLGVKDNSSVCLVTGIVDHLDSWAAGCGAGNEVVTWKADDGGVVKYLPIAGTTTPQGWTRLSDFVFAM